MSKQRSFQNLRGVPRGQPPPDPAQIMIEGYRIGDLVGVGPLTAVYRAVLESHQQEVVVKILLPHLAESEVFVQRFLQAANAARLVSHDRVLSCYDVGQSNGWVYLATEPVEGDRLDVLFAQGPIERTRAVYFAWQIAMGLEAVHGAGLVHGNLRPSNVLVDSEDGVRLADLGLPVMAEGESAASAASPAVLHLPPEAMSSGHQADQRGDIYALGIVLLGALLGRTPWTGCSRLKIQDLHARGQPVLHDAPAGLLDGDLGAVLARATACRPEERYAEVWQMREDLERLQYQFAPIHVRPVEASGGGAVREATRSTRAVQEPDRAAAPGRGRLWLTLAAVAAVLATLLGLLFSDRQVTAAAADVGPAAPAIPPVPAAPAPPAVPASPKPVWAAASGSDAHGRWADLHCGEAKQRLRLIPAGNFWMGSAGDEPGRAADEDRHLVTLSRGFWLGDTEVTQALYAAAVSGPSPAHFQAAERPVESLSWNAVQDFLAQLGGRTGAPIRLPSEAEWEYACRAGGDAPAVPGTDRAWTAASGVDGTRPVARLKPNAFGLFDMQGNVMEWVADTYGRYHRESATDPLSTGGVHRVTRGGAWNLDPTAGRPAARSKALPVAAFFYLGLRIAISE